MRDSRPDGGDTWLRVTLSSIGDAVIATDAAGRVRFLNPIAEALTGWPEHEAKGQPLAAVFHIINEKTREVVDNPVATVLATGRTVGLANHTVLIARDGTERAIDDSAAPIRGAGASVEGVVLVFRDVTGRRRVEQSTRFLASIVESSNDAIVGKDIHGIVTSWNRAAERIFGYSANEMVGQPIATLAPPDRVDEMPAILERIRRGERVEHFDTVRRAKNGRLIPVSLTVSPIRDDGGEVVGASKIARDISERKRAEEALRDERARLHATLVSIGDGVIVTDVDARVTLINPVAQSLTGWSEEDAHGRSLDEVFRIVNEETRQSVESPVAKVLREKTIVGLANHTVLVTRDGAELPIDDSGAPIYDTDGRIAAVVLVFRDVSDRRRAEERMRSVVNHVVDGIISADEDGTVTTFNPAAERIFGYSAAEVIGRNVKLLMPEPYRSEHDRYIANYLRTGEAKIIGIGREVVGRRKDGSAFPIELAISGFQLGGRHHFTGIVRDISERKRLEDELRQRAHDLAETDRRKDQFLATLAHELRNPLAPIRTALEILKMAPEDTAAPAEALSTLDRQVQQMIRLADDLLDVSRIASGKIMLQREPVVLAEVIRNSVDTVRPLIDQRQQELTVSLPSEPIHLNADPVRIAQVVANLLNNASKYTATGGHIWLTAERHLDRASLSVRDDGIGIAASHLPLVFEPFFQAEPSMERSRDGLGIGLSHVKGLVEMHGGTVDARSEGPGMGSEFRIHLPVATSARQPQVAGESEGVQARTRRRILVVDDNRDAAAMLASILQLMGHEVHTAHDGLEAVQSAARLQPEIMLLDIGLPGMDGYEVARRIRDQEGGSQVQLVAISGWGRDDDKRRAAEAGFDHHLTKPVAASMLRALIDYPEGA